MDFSKLKPKVAPNVRSLEFNGETVIYSQSTPKGYFLNNTASLIWKYCDGSHSLEEIENKILASFDAEKVEVKTHIEEILLKFYEVQLLDH